MKKNIIALGAESKNTFTVFSDKGLYISDPVNQLNHLAGINEFEDSVRTYIRENNVSPDYIACDFHPEYSTTNLAKKLSNEAEKIRLVQVQHHFAHIASCMYDNDIDEKVIGVSFDGTGYGMDGNLWGGEFLLATRKSFYRLNHIRYAPQPGGDIAAKQGWRMAISYLMQAFGDEFFDLGLPLFLGMNRRNMEIVSNMIKKNINSPLTSSAGRLFDAVSAILGICRESTFEAEAAILLEKEAAKSVCDYYTYMITPHDIDFSPVIRELVDDLYDGEDISVISAKFHNTLGEAIVDMCMRTYSAIGVDKVVISGGCFQNKFLLDYLKKRFNETKLKLYTHSKFSTTDIGISVGQAAVCANIR